MRSFSQIEAPVKFFRHLGENDPKVATPEQMASFLAGAERVEASSTGINTVVISDNSPNGTYPSTFGLVRDLGRRVTIASTVAGNPHRAIWAQVQRVGGAGSEGVPDESPDYGTGWIRIYQADAAAGYGRHIHWARLG
jgi:hypothetical protein